MSDIFDDNAIHSEMYIHLGWSTKNQQPVLSSIAPYLYHYMCELASSHCCNVVNGQVYSDHVQLVVKFSPDTILSDLMTTLKVASSLLIRTNFPEMKEFEWQKSDFMFSLSAEDVFSIINNNAKPFPEEVCIILNNNGLKFDLQEVLE